MPIKSADPDPPTDATANCHCPSGTASKAVATCADPVAVTAGRTDGVQLYPAGLGVAQMDAEEVGLAVTVDRRGQELPVSGPVDHSERRRSAAPTNELDYSPR